MKYAGGGGRERERERERDVTSVLYVNERQKKQAVPKLKRGHEGPNWEQIYSSTPPLTSVLDKVGGQRHGLAALPPGKRPGTHSTRGWVVPGPMWTGAENLFPTSIRSPDRPFPS